MWRETVTPAQGESASGLVALELWCELSVKLESELLPLLPEAKLGGQSRPDPALPSCLVDSDRHRY